MRCDIDPAKVGGVDAARDKESAAILAALPPRAHVILLAIEGKERSSEELSTRLDDLMLRGNSDIAFVIGGSGGVSDAVRARADEMLSFGRITLPHNLARVYCWSRSTAPARSAVASRITNRSAIRNNGVGQ